MSGQESIEKELASAGAKTTDFPLFRKPFHPLDDTQSDGALINYPIGGICELNLVQRSIDTTASHPSHVNYVNQPWLN